MTTKMFIAALLVTLSGCATPAQVAAHREAQTKAARAWCDRMGIRVTGIECNGERHRVLRGTRGRRPLPHVLRTRAMLVARAPFAVEP